MIEQLKEQIKVVAEARDRLQLLSNKKKALYDEFISSQVDFFADVATEATRVSEAENKLKELTLKVYAETGNKAPALGVGIREMIVLTYDMKVAFDWAKAHKMALKLDVSAFEKIAKASDLDFVKITHEPQATIATQLGEINGEKEAV